MPSIHQETGRPLADLPTIKFEKLAQRDPEEMARLLDASKREGFYYLDLSGTTQQIADDKNAVIDVMAKYFAQPKDVKIQDNRLDENGNKDHTVGYKPCGEFAGVEKGKRDSYETLKVHREEMESISSKLPSAVKEEPALFSRYMGGAQFVTLTLLSCLSDSLGLEGSARLENSHRPTQPTRTSLVMLRYPQQDPEALGVGHNKHTDIGSLTFLFSDQWGLQVLSPDSPDEWLFVEPRKEHAVINVGDSLRFLSGMRLNSCVHRVIPTEELNDDHRYSLAYFLRAEDGATYTDSQGRSLTAKEWHDGKYDVFAQSHDAQEKANVLTGGMEKGEALNAIKAY